MKRDIDSIIAGVGIILTCQNEFFRTQDLDRWFSCACISIEDNFRKNRQRIFRFIASSIFSAEFVLTCQIRFFRIRDLTRPFSAVRFSIGSTFSEIPDINIDNPVMKYVPVTKKNILMFF